MSDEREIQEVLARYVRAADHRDGAAMRDIFLPEGKVEISTTMQAQLSVLVNWPARTPLVQPLPR